MLTSRTTKLSISSPHRTTDAYDGSSSILWYPSVLSVQIAPCSILARFARNRAVSPTCTTFAPIVAVSGSGLDRIPEEGNVRNRSNCLRPPRLRSDCHPCVLAETRVLRKRILHSDNGDTGQLQAARVVLIRPNRQSQSVLQRSTRSFRPRQMHSIQWRPVRSIRMNVGGTGSRDKSWQSDQLAILTRVIYTSWLIQAFAMCILAVEVNGRTGLRERGSMSDRGGLGSEEQSVQIGGGVACKDRRTRECVTRPDGARAGHRQDQNGRMGM